MRSADEALRSAYPQALATLVRILGDLDTAQDVLQEATERALTHWDEEVPRNSAAWLVRTARNIAIDRSRRGAVERRHASDIQSAANDDPAHVEHPDAREVDEFRDDMLRLIFTCCHPALTPDSQVALTLRTVVGLHPDEIARAYRVEPSATERRISRARKALRDAALPYEVPTARDLPARLEAVCAVILVLFTEGYSIGSDVPALRPRLCELAIRLARLVARLFRQNAEVSGLLALLLLQHAHIHARMKGDGTVVSLEDQDRTSWNHARIREGKAIVDRALRRGQLGPYQIQAAIAAVHASAETFEATDWTQIAALYEVLRRYTPTAVVRLNRAVAISRARGPEEGLAALLEIEDAPELKGYHLFHAARGHLLEASGRNPEALSAYRTALELVPNDVERRYLEAKIEALG